MPFVTDWENTCHADPEMRVISTCRIKRSEDALDMICAVIYWETIFIKNIKVLE